MKIQSKLDLMKKEYLIYKEMRFSTTHSVEVIQFILPKKQQFTGTQSIFDPTTKKWSRITITTNVVNIVSENELLVDEINQFIPELKLNAFHLRSSCIDVSRNNEVWIIKTSFAEKARTKDDKEAMIKRMDMLRKRLLP